MSAGAGWPAVRRAWARAGFLEVWLLVELSVPVDAPQLGAACDAGDAALIERGLDSSGWAMPVVGTSRGVIVHHLGTEDEALAEAWFEAFSGSLAAAGLPARIKPARTDHGPEWAFPAWEVSRQLATFVSYRMSEQARARPVHEQVRMWGVDPALTQAAADSAVNWVTLPGGRVYFGRETFSVRATAEGLGRAATDSLLDGYLTYLSGAATNPARVRSISFGRAGQAVYVARDDSKPWHARVDDVRSALLALPADTQLGFVRYSVSCSASWADIGTAGSPRPRLRHPQSFAGAPGLHAHLVPDAHGMQLLTGEHLQRANSLSEWDVDEVAPNRYLVTTKHLADWFEDGPDEKTLSAARDDFGAMIARDQDIR